MTVSRQQILDTLAGAAPELQRSYAVGTLALFGSAARDELTASSDIDVLVEFTRPVGIFHVLRLKHHLQELLGVENVDLLTAEGLDEQVRSAIQKDLIRAA